MDGTNALQAVLSSDIVAFVGWAFLPDFVTNNLQWLYYKVTVRNGAIAPIPGSPQFMKHRRRIYIAVILLYLAWTIFEADRDVVRTSDFYDYLGVPYDVDERALAKKYRRLTLQYHPDKLPKGVSEAERLNAEAVYSHITIAKDTIQDPAKRFAYDRFGPESLKWTHETTMKEFVFAGLKTLVPFYTGSAIFMTVFGWMGFGDYGNYWRYLALAAFAAFELHTVTSAGHPLLTRLPRLPALFIPDANAMFPFGWGARTLDRLTFGAVAAAFWRQPYLPFQALRVAHRLIIAFFIALNRLGPTIASMLEDPEERAAGAGDDGDEALRVSLARMERAVGVSCAESRRLLGLELVPFRGDDDAAAAASGAPKGNSAVGTKYLKDKVKEWFVTNSIRNEDEVQKAVGKVVERRQGKKAGGGGGGKGGR